MGERDRSLLRCQEWLRRSEAQAWSSWGKFDSNQFARECEMKSLENPVGNLQHLNLKSLFARKYGHRVGLERALGLRKLVFKGNPHSGIDDAKNVAQVLSAERIIARSRCQTVGSTATTALVKAKLIAFRRLISFIVPRLNITLMCAPNFRN